MNTEALKKYVEQLWNLYQPENLIVNLAEILGGVIVKNDYTYLENFAKRHDLILNGEELEKKYENAQRIINTAKENGGFYDRPSAKWIERIKESNIDFFADDFNIKEHISKYKYKREDIDKLPEIVKIVINNFLKEWNDNKKYNVIPLQYKLPDESKIVFDLYYILKDDKKIFKSINILKIDKNNEIMDYDASKIFLLQVLYKESKSANNLLLKSFTKDYSFEKICRIDLEGDKNAYKSSQYDYNDDYLIEVNETSKNNSISYDSKESYKLYKNGILKTLSNKKITEDYQQAIQFSNDKELILSFQMLSNNGIPTPIKINKDENDDFVVSYILTTKTIVNWTFTVKNNSIDLVIKEQNISPKEKHYGKELITNHKMSKYPDEFELEAMSIGNQLFYQDLKTTEEVLNKLPKLIDFYNKVEKDYNGSIDSIKKHMQEAEDLFTSFKYMSYSRRLKKENEKITKKI